MQLHTPAWQALVRSWVADVLVQSTPIPLVCICPHISQPSLPPRYRRPIWITPHCHFPIKLLQITVLWIIINYYYYKRWCLKWHYLAQTLQGHLTSTKTVTCWQWRGSGISILVKGCPEQYCYQLMLKGHQWLFICDGRRQGAVWYHALLEKLRSYSSSSDDNYFCY